MNNLSPEDKNAIENLIILARYVEDNSIFTKEDRATTRRSIARAEKLIGRQAGQDSEMDAAAQEAIEMVKSKFSS